MIPSKYKAAHYLVNRFKELPEVEKWFERQSGIYDDKDLYELWNYFQTKCEKDLILLATCSDDVETREIKIINTANILRYCHNNIQEILRNKITDPVTRL